MSRSSHSSPPIIYHFSHGACRLAGSGTYGMTVSFLPAEVSIILICFLVLIAISLATSECMSHYSISSSPRSETLISLVILALRTWAIWNQCRRVLVTLIVAALIKVPFLILVLYNLLKRIQCESSLNLPDYHRLMIDRYGSLYRWHNLHQDQTTNMGNIVVRNNSGDGNSWVGLPYRVQIINAKHSDCRFDHGQSCWR